jgi:hypothetical protein
MASAIDATKPVTGSATTSAVRANFAAAEAEIDELHRATEDSVTAAGTVDALTANFTKDVVLAEGVTIVVKAAGANTSTTPTLNVDATGVRTIVKDSGAALVAGDIAGARHFCVFRYDLANTVWVLMNPVTGGDSGTLGGIAPASFARTDIAETFDAAVTVNATLTVDDLAGTARPAGFNVAAPETHNAAYTLVLADAGKMMYHSEATARAWTIPPNSSVAFPIGTVINFLNQSTGDITVTRGSGVALYFFEGDGATAPDADRVLDGSGVCTITKISSDGWAIWGVGLT